MTIYTWLVVLLVAAAIVFKGYRKHSNVFLIIAFLLLFAVMGLRDVYAIGSDASGFGSYPVIYQRWGTSEWNSIIGRGDGNYNIGFNYLCKLIYELTGGDYQWFVSIISFFVTVAYVRFMGKYSPSPFLSILCFIGLLYYTFLFDALKQAIAMSTLLFAFDAMIERKPIRFIIITFIAALFHFPAIVFLPAYWIGRMRIGRSYVLLLAVLLFLTYVFRSQLLRLMMNAYSNNESTASMEGIAFLRNKVIIMIAFAVFAAVIRPPAYGDTLYNALLIFLGVAIIFQTFSGYNNIFERLADYYFHTSIILVPLILEKSGRSALRIDMEKNNKILNYATVIICVFAIWRFLSLVNNSAIYMPYRFLWER